MSEKESGLCEVCGKTYDCVMTISSGDIKSPAMCKKCFKKVTDENLKRLKEAKMTGMNAEEVRTATNVSPIGGTSIETDAEFFDANEAEKIAKEIIKENEVAFGHLKNYSIRYIFKQELTGIGKAILVRGMYEFLTEINGVVLLCYATWKGLNDRQRHGLIDHLISHFGESEDGDKLGILKPEVSEFSGTARRWGAWSPSLEIFKAQLDLFKDTNKIKK